MTLDNNNELPTQEMVEEKLKYAADQAAATPGQILFNAGPKPVEALTSERGSTHGDYNNTARYIRNLKSIVATACVERANRGQLALTYQQRESLDMIMHKAGRILSGDPSFQDHWDDIAGYAHLANKVF